MTARHFAETANLALENRIFFLNSSLFEAIMVSVLAIMRYLILMVVIREDFMVMRDGLPNLIALIDKIAGYCDC